MELGALYRVDFVLAFSLQNGVGILTFSIFLWLVKGSAPPKGAVVLGSLSTSSAPLSSTVCCMFVLHCAGGLRLTEMSGGTAVVQGEVLEISQDQDCSNFCV